MRACSALAILLVTLTFSACGKSTPSPSSTPASVAAPASSSPAASESAAVAPAALPKITEIKKVDAAGFTLGEYLPPLDGGKIEIAVPDGWNVMPRDSKYVVRFSSLQSGGGLPRIDVVVEEKNLGDLTDVSAANVADFAAAVAKDLEANATAVIEPPIPMVIGSVACARYVSHLKLKIGEGTFLVERQTIELLHAGRRYKINLLVEREKVADSRDAAYALCSSVRFPASE